MSIQIRLERYEVVVCDICDDFSYIGDGKWRKMPQTFEGQALHLCRKCKPDAVWCVAHEQYHRPDVFHRQPCVDCGGLFTSVARDAIVHCPTCRRGISDVGKVTSSAPKQPRTLGQRLLSPLTRYLH